MGTTNWKESKTYLKELNNHKDKLTKQQYKTLKGQILSGDYIGAEKGLKKLIRKKVITWQDQDNQ